MFSGLDGITISFVNEKMVLLEIMAIALKRDYFRLHFFSLFEFEFELLFISYAANLIVFVVTVCLLNDPSIKSSHVRRRNVVLQYLGVGVGRAVLEQCVGVPKVVGSNPAVAQCKEGADF
jgi:hypothetical protein